MRIREIRDKIRRIRREKSERRENLEGRKQEKRVGEDNTILCLLFKSSKST